MSVTVFVFVILLAIFFLCKDRKLDPYDIQEINKDGIGPETDKGDIESSRKMT